MTEENILSLLGDSKRVLLIGEICVEHLIHGTRKRFDNNHQIPIFTQRGEEYQIGQAGIIAQNLRAMRLAVDLISVVDCKHMDIVLKLLDGLEINASGIYKSNTCLIRCVTKYVADKQVCFISEKEAEDEIGDVIKMHFSQRIKEWIENMFWDAIIVTDFCDKLLPHVNTQKIIQIARKRNIPIVANSKETKNYTMFAGATCLYTRMNQSREMAAVMSSFDIDGCIVEVPDNDVIFYNNSDKKVLHSNTNGNLKFTSRNGPAVLAVAVFGICHGWCFERIFQFIDRSRKYITGSLGRAVINMIEIIPDKIINDRNSLLNFRRIIPKDKTVVLTTGCFDLMHAGHVESLRQAKALGDYVIIALNSDESVVKNKGRGRPIIPLRERVVSLMALKYVDFIVTFDEKRPDWIVETLAPDVFVKGVDYNEEHLRSVFPCLKKIYLTPCITSTTSIIQKIKDL